jgi:hypothetical protein
MEFHGLDLTRAPEQIGESVGTCFQALERQEGAGGGDIDSCPNSGDAFSMMIYWNTSTAI